MRQVRRVGASDDAFEKSDEVDFDEVLKVPAKPAAPDVGEADK